MAKHPSDGVIKESTVVIEAHPDGPTVLEDKSEEDTGTEFELQGLVVLIQDRFMDAEEKRQTHEARWMKAYRNYRGQYGPDMVFRSDEKSRVFVKITKTKVLAAFGQLMEVVFSSNKFPISIEPTRVPEGIAEFAHTDPAGAPPISQAIADKFGFEGDGKELAPGATNVTGGLGPPYAETGLIEGKAFLGEQQIEVNPADVAAKRMEKKIHDQLDSSSALNVLSRSLLEMALLGTGIIKGPFNFNKTINKWIKNPDTGERVYSPEEKMVPRISSVSLWDAYPDPNATSVEDAEYFIERHKLSRTQLRKLKKRPYFRGNAIEDCVEQGPNYTQRGYESIIGDEQATPESTRYEVLEYWGIMDKELAREADFDFDELDFGEESDSGKEVQINAWICGPHLLRLVLNPFIPERLPYHVAPYETNPYQLFGIGVAENMEDSQQIMNGHARMAIDNLAISGNIVFDIDEQSLVPGEEFVIHPGKIFRRQSGQPGQAVFAIKFPNTTTENMQMFDKFRQLADEQTGIPSFSHGQTGVQSMTRTASGMSMLFGASALNIKTVIKNLDYFLLQPLGEQFFAWNMQFGEDEDDEFVGDLEVRARGTSALMQKEVRSQRLMMFLQFASNPFLVPLIKWRTFILEVADSLELDRDKVLNDPQEAALYSKLIGNMNVNSQGQGASTSGGQSNSLGGSGGASAGATANDATGVGGGTIGTGNIPQPGEGSFSA